MLQRKRNTWGVIIIEQKYQIGNKYGTILWDINSILEHCSDYPIMEYSTKELADKFPFHGNETYALKTNTSIPGIIVQLSVDYHILIDGNHRLYKAKVNNIPIFQCYYLRKDEHIKYIVNYDPKIYSNVVLHWNE